MQQRKDVMIGWSELGYHEDGVGWYTVGTLTYGGMDIKVSYVLSKFDTLISMKKQLRET